MWQLAYRNALGQKKGQEQKSFDDEGPLTCLDQPTRQLTFNRVQIWNGALRVGVACRCPCFHRAKKRKLCFHRHAKSFKGMNGQHTTSPMGVPSKNSKPSKLVRSTLQNIPLNNRPSLNRERKSGQIKPSNPIHSISVTLIEWFLLALLLLLLPFFFFFRFIQTDRMHKWKEKTMSDVRQ